MLGGVTAVDTSLLDRDSSSLLSINDGDDTFDVGWVDKRVE